MNARNRTLAIVGALLAIVIAAGVIFAVVAGGGDDPNSSSNTSAGVDLFPGVTIEGDSLPPFSQEVGAGEAPDPAIGHDVPVISGFDYHGDPVIIDPANDGPTLVVFLAHWCPHCNREIPVLNGWRDSGDVPDGLNIIGVSTAVTATRDNYPPDAWLVSKDWTWPVIADAELNQNNDPPSAFDAYGGTGFPTMVFVDGDGQVVRRISGEYPVEAIQQFVDELMATTT